MDKNKLVKYTLSLIILSEILSFVTYLNPSFSCWIFGLVSIAIIIITVYKLEYGVFIAIVELIIGSLGKMFILEMNGFDLSIRMVIWVVLLSVWMAQALKRREVSFLRSKLFYSFLGLVIVLAWSTLWGLIRDNGLGVVFADVNNYFYFALVFPIYGILRSRIAIERIHYILVVAVSWLSIKTIALFYIFSHEFFNLQDSLYSWLRMTRLAEITNVDPNILLSRIFMQSQIWILFFSFIYLTVSLKIIIPFIYKSSVYKNTEEDKEEKEDPIDYKDELITKRTTIIRIIKVLFFIAIPMSAIIISFSRSFWLAWIIVFIFGIIIYFIRRFRKKRLKKFFVFAGLTSLIIIASIGLTLSVASFPIPKGAASADLLRNRAAKFTGEAAVSSRYSQIRPLLESIKNHPIIGSGFGTSVTYESQDPRVLENNPNGEYTTTAFELGWLEIWLKLGLIGVVAYLYLLYKICKIGYKSITHMPQGKIKKYALAGILAGLFTVALTHTVSPYLNHPLGIGIVILCISLVERKFVKKPLFTKTRSFDSV